MSKTPPPLFLNENRQIASLVEEPSMVVTCSFSLPHLGKTVVLQDLPNMGFD